MYIPNSRERGNQVSVRDFLEGPASVALQIIRGDTACFEALSKALCVHYYLPCGSNGSIHVPQFLCPDVCNYLVNDVCRIEWPILLNEFQSRIAPITIGLEFPVCNNTSQAVSYLNLSNDCCSNAGIVVPSSTPQITSTQLPTAVVIIRNTVAIISSSIAGSVVLIVGITVACLLILMLFLWMKKRNRMDMKHSRERYFYTCIEHENYFFYIAHTLPMIVKLMVSKCIASMNKTI